MENDAFYNDGETKIPVRICQWFRDSETGRVLAVIELPSGEFRIVDMGFLRGMIRD